ncbi:hypothetical protein C1A50_1532 [Paenibacillus polymyxa]|nr:hypothetical protein C1A50_1532 [Paenibacillus polymyxa]
MFYIHEFIFAFMQMHMLTVPKKRIIFSDHALQMTFFK